MRVRSRNGYVEHFARQNVRGGIASADNRRSRAVNARVRSLRAAKPEFHNVIALRRTANFCRLRGDKRLVIYHVQNCRFDELSLDNGGFDGENRLPRENHRPFGNGINIAREFKVFKIIQKILVEDVKFFEVCDFLFAEIKPENVIDDLFKPRRERISYKLFSAEENVEHGNFVRHAF